jgi:cyclopropane-fatty-acyl-phospholipid synthase
MTSSATTHSSNPSEPIDRATPAAVPRQAAMILRLLERIETGTLTLDLPDGSRRTVGRGEPAASISVRDWTVFGDALRRGDVGFAEGWIDGQWSTDSLSRLLSLLVINRRAIESAVYGTWWGQLFDRLRHLLRANTRAGSRRNIHAHYDLGNAFYQLWLDPGMTYSSALFEGDFSRSLEDAQHAKNRRLLDELALAAGSSVLEIGCGWGGFAEAAASRGLHVTGLTLSTEQLAYARERLALTAYGQARFVLCDYRDETGVYDGLASVEMFEAVGERYWRSWFQTVARCLRPGGRAAIQTITIDEALFERYRRGTDFIQQYVFPGGMLPTRSGFAALAREAGLQVLAQHSFGPDYALTLKRWRERFMTVLDQVRALDFDDRFIRTWEFYLAYCEAAFEHGNTDVVQFTLVRP